MFQFQCTLICLYRGIDMTVVIFFVNIFVFPKISKNGINYKWLTVQCLFYILAQLGHILKTNASKKENLKNLLYMVSFFNT
jgi:hypothetical protein